MMDEPGPLNEEELLERLQEEMRKITVSDYLAHLLVSLSSMAFQRLGLTPDTLVDRDLSQSRMAIDAFEALVKVLSTGLSEQDAAMYRSTVHQMRMAYLRAAEAGADRVQNGETDQGTSADEVAEAAQADEVAEVAEVAQVDEVDAGENQTGSSVDEKE